MPMFKNQVSIQEFISACTPVELRQLVLAASDRLAMRGISIEERDVDAPPDIAPDVGICELASVLRSGSLSRHAIYVARRAGLPI